MANVARQSHLHALEARHVRSHDELVAAVDAMVRGVLGAAVVVRPFPIRETIVIAPPHRVRLVGEGSGALYAGLGMTDPLFQVESSADAPPVFLPDAGVSFDRLPMSAAGGCVLALAGPVVEMRDCVTSSGAIFTGEADRVRIAGCDFSTMSVEALEQHITGNRGGNITLLDGGTGTVVVVANNLATAGTSPTLNIADVAGALTEEANNAGYTVVT